MKKKIIFISIFLIILVVILFATIQTQNNLPNYNNTTNFENSIQTRNTLSNENNQNSSENILNEVTQKNKVENSNNSIFNNSTNKSSLPSDEGLTVNGVPKTLNQDIISKANIAYLLGCDNPTDEVNCEKYIQEKTYKPGILISEQTIYKVDPNNPYDSLIERKEIMKNKLSDIHLSYDIDKNNYLIANTGNSELEQKLNKLINGNKTIIVGFTPEYYNYINDTDYGIQLGGSFRKNYVSFKPFNNIYAYIFDENSSDIDDFYEMIQEIANLAE